MRLHSTLVHLVQHPLLLQMNPFKQYSNYCALPCATLTPSFLLPSHSHYAEGSLPSLPLPSLRTLHLGDNQLTHVPDGLSACKRLEELYLERNCLTKLALPAFPRLTDLSVSGNSLRSLHFIKHLPALAVLRADHNSIDATTFPPHESLQELYLAHNSLAQVAPLASACPALQVGVWF